MNNWHQTSIGDFIDFNPSETIIKGTLCRKISMDKLGVFQRKINGSEYSNYIAGPKFRNGDTLVAKITPCLENGKTAYVDILKENEVAFGSSEFIVLRSNKLSDKKFIYYLARSPLFREKAISCMEGTSGRKRVNEGALKRQEILVPDLSNQQKITYVLSALDNKIELNKKINDNLEQMAKAIYDYWFIQFDFPNENGKPYKSSGGEMNYNEELKREIPENWEVKELTDIANITMGQSPPGETYNKDYNGAIFFQGCTDFGNRFPTIRKYTTAPTRFAKKGDILLSVRAPVGTLNLAKENCCIGRGLAALNSKNRASTFLYGVMINLKQIFDRRNVNGTTFGSITKDDLYSLKVVVPTDEILHRYEQAIKSSFKRQNIIENQNTELRRLRDLLLPMLMNGQVTVK